MRMRGSRVGHGILDRKGFGVGWSRVVGIRAAILCVLLLRRHPTETPRVQPRGGFNRDRLLRLQFEGIHLIEDL